LLLIDRQRDCNMVERSFSAEGTLTSEVYVLVFVEDPTVAANLDHQTDRPFPRLDHDRKQEETRFDLARHLLQATDTSVTEIGFEIGYTNPANFSRAFQRWAGVSPRQYRTHTLQ